MAASLPNKGYLVSVFKEKDTVIAYAFASRQEGQLPVERLGVRPENRRKGIGSGLMVSLIFAAREMKLSVITCSLDEENLGGSYSSSTTTSRRCQRPSRREERRLFILLGRRMANRRRTID